MIVLVVALTVITALLALLVVGLLRSHAEILRRLHELGAGMDEDLPAGSPAQRAAGAATSPPADGPQPGRDFQVMPQVPSPPQREGMAGAADLVGLGPDGREAVSIRVTGVEHDTIVAFLSSGCITCQKFWDAFRKPRKLGLPRGTRLVVVTKGPDAESLSEVSKLAPSGVPTVMSSEAFVDFDVPGSPYFVQVHGPTGKVRGEGTGPDWDQVSSLLGQASGDAELDASLSPNAVPKPDADAQREARIDQELFEAGIAPGDPSLYPDGDPSAPDAGADSGHDHRH